MSIDVRATFRRGSHVEALLDGRVTSDRVRLEFTPVEPISRAFRSAIRENEFDVTEMALITLAMAADAGYPWIGLPVVVMRGFHHGALRTAMGSQIRSPQDLLGSTVGVRAYSQTTGVWVRGILAQQFGVDTNRITWLTTEDAHIPGFTDPDCVRRAPDGVKLQDLLFSGKIAAAIGDGSTSFSDSRSVIPEPDAAAAHWREETGVCPVNHVIAFRRELLEQEPFIATELQKMFQQSRDLWLQSARAGDNLPYGRGSHQKSIELGLEFAAQQRLTSKVFRYDELFFPVD